MQLFCPACRAVFTGVSRCPRCAELLLMPEEAIVSPDSQPNCPPVDRWHPTPTGRVLVGTLVALGFYLGLRRVATGLIVAAEIDQTGWWLTAEGLSVVFGLQAIACLFGASLAGAGRAKGFSLGAAVGGLCGGLFLAAEVIAGAPPEHLVLYLQPLLLLLSGGVAGGVGSRVWKPMPELDMPSPLVPSGQRGSSIQLQADLPKDAGRPTVWLRVLAGATIIMLGVGFADKIRNGAQKVSGGLLKVESRGQGRFISWQMATLAVLTGGAFAAAGTGAGVRHGLFAGFLGGIGVVGAIAAQGSLPPSAAYFVEKFKLGTNNPQDPAALMAIICGVVLASAVGGWLGGQLFLPLVPPHVRNRRLRIGID